MSTTGPTTATPPSVPTPTAELPLVIVGAGPIGLAAAAHAQSRGLPTVVLEAGDSAGASILEWAHVRLFSAWSELVDPAAAKLQPFIGKGPCTIARKSIKSACTMP